MLYTVYASTLADVVDNFPLNILGYADDHSLYCAFNPNKNVEESETIPSVESCLEDVRKWMCANR